jgi:hypothetical protein
MLGHEAVPGAGRVDPATGVLGAHPPGTRQQVVRADTVASTVITAEIPAVPVRRSYGVLLPDGTVWYPGSNKRLPAPWALRMVVWVLILITFLMLAGLVVVLTHPSWLSSLRHTVTAPSAASRTGTGPTGGGGSSSTVSTVNTGAPGSTTSGAGGGGGGGGQTVAGCSVGSSGVTCKVPSNNYTIVFTTTNKCFVQIAQLPSGTFVATPTQNPNQTVNYPVSGTTTLRAFRSGASFAIAVGGKTVIKSQPATFNVLFTFQPASSTSSTG